MKKILAMVMAMFMLFSVMSSVAVFAENEVIEDELPEDNLTGTETYTKDTLEEMGYTAVDADPEGGNDLYGWKVTTDGVLDIYYTGNPVMNYEEKTCINRPWNSKIKDITSVVINGEPTEIGKYTFYKMSNLKSFTLPETVKTISAGAFANTNIGDILTIPGHITKVNGTAFMNCPVRVLVYEGDANSGILWLDKGIQYLGMLTNIVVKRQLGISNLNINEGKRTLKDFGGTYANGINGMTNPAKINVVTTDSKYADTFKSITPYAVAYTVENSKEDGLHPELFKNIAVCEAKKGIKIGNFTDDVWYLLYDENLDEGVTDYTVEFVTNGNENGTKLTDYGYTLNGDQYTINDTYLSKVPGAIKKMVFGYGITQVQSNFGTNKGGSNVYGPGVYTLYKNLREVVFPKKFTIVWKNAFCNIRTLKKVNFEDTMITTFKEKAFAYCPLETVKLPSTVTKIEKNAFVGNTALETLYLPSSANLVVGEKAFARETIQSGFNGKSLKVICDGTQFTVANDKVAPNAFSYESSLTNVPSDKPWRKTVLIYDSNDNWTNTSALGLQDVSVVADKYFETKDSSTAGKLDLWMYNHNNAQNYNMFIATYSSKVLDKAESLKSGILPAATVLSEKVDIASYLSEDEEEKIFLWEDFVNLNPLTSVIEK